MNMLKIRPAKAKVDSDTHRTQQHQQQKLQHRLHHSTSSTQKRGSQSRFCCPCNSCCVRMTASNRRFFISAAIVAAVAIATACYLSAMMVLVPSDSIHPLQQQHQQHQRESVADAVASASHTLQSITKEEDGSASLQAEQAETSLPPLEATPATTAASAMEGIANAGADANESKNFNEYENTDGNDNGIGSDANANTMMDVNDDHDNTDQSQQQLQSDGEQLQKQASSESIASTGPRAPVYGALVPKMLNANDAPTAYYMLPPSGSPTAVLFFFHGCRHTGVDFFILPQDRIVAHATLRHNLAIISFTASKPSGCWSHRDMPLVQKQIDEFTRVTGFKVHTGKEQADADATHGEENASGKTNGNNNNDDDERNALRILATGMSMGVSEVFWLEDEDYDFAAMALYSTYHYIDDVDNLANIDNTTAYAPSIWIHMPRDSNTHENVEDNYEILDHTNSIHEEFRIHPRPFTPQRCEQYLPELGNEGCRRLIHELQEGGFVSDDDYQLIQRPDRWLIDPILKRLGYDHLSVLQDGAELSIPSNVFLDMHIAHSNKEERYSSWPRTSFAHHTWLWACVEQELAICYAHHEMVSDHHDAVMQFLLRYV